MKYNSGAKYNYTSSIYNNAMFRIFVNVYDAFELYESQMENIAKIIFTERIEIQDFMEFFVLHEFNDSFKANDKSDYFAMFDLMEKVDLQDSFSDLIVLLQIFDKQSALDELRELEAVISNSEKISAKDLNSIQALMNIAETANLKEAESIIALLNQFETVDVSDRTPRKAISDFLIGQIDGKDSAYDWLSPFDMKIDWKNTSIQVMPSTESTYIEMPGRDGSLVEDTVYKNRLFSIVAFSEQGMSIYEKEQMKRDIAQILDSTKNAPKKLTIQSADVAFDVKYSGSADITGGPSYVKATIPFETSPYGYPLFDREVFGTGLIVNDGDADVGCVHKISAGCVNPKFQLGKITYSFDGTVPENSTLVIDHDNYTCYIEGVEGTRTNVLDKLTGEFQVIPKQTRIALTAYPETEKYIFTTIKEKILW